MTIARDVIERLMNENTYEKSMVDLLQSIKTKFKVNLKPGRNTINGLPFDVEDSSELPLSLKGVDSDATKDLVKLFRKNGFQAKRDGSLYITVQ